MTTITREQLLAIFKQRASTRHYDASKKISAEDFQTILECARLSPSSVGSEPWQFLIIQNPKLREKLAPFSWGMATQLADCSHLVVILAKKNARFDTPFFRDIAERRGFSGEELEKVLKKYQGLQEVELNIANDERALFDWTSKQTYIALANMLTGAAALGIDSCPIEGFNYAKMNETLAAEGLFDPTEWGVSVAATFGYRAREIKPKARKPMEQLVNWVN